MQAFLKAVLVWSGVIVQASLAMNYHSILISYSIRLSESELMTAWTIFGLLMMTLWMWSSLIFTQSEYYDRQTIFSSLLVVLLLSHSQILLANLIIHLRPIKYLLHYYGFWLGILFLMVDARWTPHRSRWQDGIMVAIALPLAIYGQRTRARWIFLPVIMMIDVMYSRDWLWTKKTHHRVIWPYLLGLSLLLNVGQHFFFMAMRKKMMIRDSLPLRGFHNSAAKLMIVKEFCNLYLQPNDVRLTIPGFRRYLQETPRSLADYRRDAPGLLRAALHDPNIQAIEILWLNKEIPIGVVIVYPHHVEVFFRGTQTRKEMLRNIVGLNTVFSPTDRGYKHSQITSLVHWIMPDIEALLHRHESSTRSITLCGHSRGCILALYTALQLRRIFPTASLRLFLYASPPMVDPYMRESLRGMEIHTLIHVHDPILRLHTSMPFGTSLANDRAHLIRRSLSSLPKEEYRLHYEKKTDRFIVARRRRTIDIGYHELYSYFLLTRPKKKTN